jgi:hypothetical protein
VGEITYRATRDVIEYMALEPATLKGKREAVPLWQATSARSRFGVDVEQARTPFIAREPECLPAPRFRYQFLSRFRRLKDGISLLNGSARRGPDPVSTARNTLFLGTRSS